MSGETDNTAEVAATTDRPETLGVGQYITTGHDAIERRKRGNASARRGHSRGTSSSAATPSEDSREGRTAHRNRPKCRPYAASSEGVAALGLFDGRRSIAISYQILRLSEQITEYSSNRNKKLADDSFQMHNHQRACLEQIVTREQISCRWFVLTATKYI